ncbi:uncharacterized protein B0P05DRAFT_572844 [Gilbertella persicaria]|uniref:uncharacterized protein n=1 Tax=Gilbertella persicaria TaxID=101096 RepID=UPI00221FFACC|nr:uncharacterized protein B0P05DRAFT_572844 [Gilbertella persicaria]KAI8074248.1 hypothetical protein B0P05DRAFT_572844 [Gilbertella persicaria]
MAFENGSNSVIQARPDYRADVYNSSCSIESTNLYGELKPKGTKFSDLLQDFYKVTLFGKIDLKSSNTGVVMTFRSVDNFVQHYLHFRAINFGFVCLSLGEVEVPITKGTCMSILASLPFLCELAYIYDHACLNHTEALVPY